MHESLEEAAADSPAEADLSQSLRALDDQVALGEAHGERAVEQCEEFVADHRATPALQERATVALASGESDLAVLEQIMRFAPAGNLTGLPAISVPAGADEHGLPVGLQIMGRAWEEALLLRLAAVVEQAVARRSPQAHWRLLG